MQDDFVKKTNLYQPWKKRCPCTGVVEATIITIFPTAGFYLP
jgi:hypothetical protein